MKNELDELNPTERFSNRVADYHSRPSYPSELLDYIETKIGNLKDLETADIGAGTGIFTRLLAERGAKVFAVEPNPVMRASACQLLSKTGTIEFCKGSAEATGLKDQCIDLVTCAQAFHWFDVAKTKVETKRILRTNGHVALIWNTHDETTQLGRLYKLNNEKFGNETYAKVEARRDRLPETIPQFLKSGFEKKVFDNSQTLDRDGFLARYFSSSYAPANGSKEKEQATIALNQLFEQFNESGKITIRYQTELFLGQL